MREEPARTEAIRHRDPTALEGVVRECLPALLRTARAAGLDQERAEDAVQDALLVFVRRAHDFDGRARASTWIQGILVRTISQGRRALRRDATRDPIDDVMESRFDETGRWSRPPQGPGEALAVSEVRRHLQDCIDVVPDRQRLVFTLRDVEGFDTDEICKILGVSANNVGVLLFRARNRLRECLESKGVEGSDDAHM